MLIINYRSAHIFSLSLSYSLFLFFSKPTLCHRHQYSVHFPSLLLRKEELCRLCGKYFHSHERNSQRAKKKQRERERERRAGKLWFCFCGNFFLSQTGCGLLSSRALKALFRESENKKTSNQRPFGMKSIIWLKIERERWRERSMWQTL